MFSRTFTWRVLPALMLLALTVFAGCKPGQAYTISEEDEPDYRKGEGLMRENRMNEALLSFEKVVDLRRDCPESHLELGRIYMDHVKDPIAAIYHFRKYLELRPDSDVAKQVTQLIETCKKDFARSLPGDPFGDSVEHMDVLEQFKKLRLENDELRRTVASLQSQVRDARSEVAQAQTPPNLPTPSVTQQQTPQAQPQQQRTTGARTYTIKPGDTLMRISAAVYGTPSRWQDIYNANRNQLKSPHDLRVGLVLAIPQ